MSTAAATDADARRSVVAPLPEGSLTIREAFVGLRSLPEPLEHLEGRLDLRGAARRDRTLGPVSGGAFRGGGSYRFAEDRSRRPSRAGSTSRCFARASRRRANCAVR